MDDKMSSTEIKNKARRVGNARYLAHIKEMRAKREEERKQKEMEAEAKRIEEAEAKRIKEEEEAKAKRIKEEEEAKAERLKEEEEARRIFKSHVCILSHHLLVYYTHSTIQIIRRKGGI